jgi:hypothetical protein
MKISQIILEYDRDVSKEKWGDKLFASAQKDGTILNYKPGSYIHVDIEKFHILQHLLQQFEVSDPTPGNKYVPWIVRMYSNQNGRLKLEDINTTLSDDLEKFSKLIHGKKLPTQLRDINKFKTPDEFYTVVEKYASNLEKEPENRGKYEEYLNNDKVRIIIPKDAQAARFWGQGTRWCTSSKKNEHTFSRYGGGRQHSPLFIIIPKHPKYPGEKYQTQGNLLAERPPFWTPESIKNEKDLDLDISQLEDLQKRIELDKSLSTKLQQDFEYDIDDPLYQSLNKAEIPSWMTKSPKEIVLSHDFVKDQEDDYSDDEYDELEHQMRSKKSKMRKRRE